MNQNKINNIMDIFDEEKNPSIVSEGVKKEDSVVIESNEELIEETEIEERIELPIEEEIDDSPILETEVEVTPEPEVEVELEEETGIVKTDDGLEVIIEEDTPIEDETPAIYQAEFKYDKLKEISNDGILFGNSRYTLPKENEDLTPLDILRNLRYSGEFLDVFLPVTNVAVRIYEFDVNLFVKDNLIHLKTLEERKEDRITIQQTITKQLLEAIENNCVFLTKDGTTIKNLAFDQISKADVDLLLLATGALLTKSYNKTIGKDDFIHTTTNPCVHCGQMLEINFDVVELIRQQYAEISPEVQLAINSYNPNETFMEKLNKSQHSKVKHIKYKKNTEGGPILITTIIKDPSYVVSERMLDSAHAYILNKTRDGLAEITNNIPGYYTMSNGRKISRILDMIDEGTDVLTEAAYELNSLVQLSIMIPYISRMEFSFPGQPKQVVEFSGSSISELFNILKDTPSKLRESILKHIGDFVKAGTKPIKMNYTCQHCKTEDEVFISPIELFLWLIYRVVTSTM